MLFFSLSSCVRLFVILWTVACQSPLSMGFSRQKRWSGSPSSLGIEPSFHELQTRFLTVSIHQRLCKDTSRLPTCSFSPPIPQTGESPQRQREISASFEDQLADGSELLESADKRHRKQRNRACRTYKQGTSMTQIRRRFVNQRGKNFLGLPCRLRPRFNPRIWKIPCRRAWQPTPVFLPGESHGQRSLSGCSPRGREGSDD